MNRYLVIALLFALIGACSYESPAPAVQGAISNHAAALAAI